MAKQDHEQIADSLEREADDMEHQGEKVDEHISQTRADWRRRQRDPRVPGAESDDDERGEPDEEAAPEGPAD